MEGEHRKIDMICPSLVTPFKPGKRSSGLSQMISMKKKHIYFCPQGMIMKLQTLIICSVASLFAADTIFFFIFFNLSKTRYTLLPGIKIIKKLLRFNQAANCFSCGSFFNSYSVSFIVSKFN